MLVATKRPAIIFSLAEVLVQRLSTAFSTSASASLLEQHPVVAEITEDINNEDRVFKRRTQNPQKSPRTSTVQRRKVAGGERKVAGGELKMAGKERKVAGGELKVAGGGIQSSLEQIRKLSVKQKTEMSQFQRQFTNDDPIDMSAPIAHFNDDLRAFVDVCVKTDQLDRVHAGILYYFGMQPAGNTEDLEGKQQNRYQIRDVAPVGTVMEAWARRGGRTSRIYDLFVGLRQSGLKPTPSCYYSLILSLAKDKPFDEHAVKSALRELAEDGLSIADIFGVCSSADHGIIADAILRIDPGACIPSPEKFPRSFQTNYEQELVRCLNSKMPLSSESIDGLANWLNEIEGENSISKIVEDQVERDKRNQISVQSIFPPAKHSAAKVKEARIAFDGIKSLWASEIRSALERDFATMETRFLGDWSISLLPFLRCLSTDSLAKLVVEELERLFSLSDLYSPSLSQLASRLGQRVQRRFIVEHFQSTGQDVTFRKSFEAYLKSFKLPVEQRQSTLRDAWLQASVENGFADSPASVIWPHNISRAVGKFLFNVALNDVKFDAQVVRRVTGGRLSSKKEASKLPIVYLIYRHHGSVISQEIKLHPQIRQLYGMADSGTLLFSAEELPSQVPPVPWTTPFRGLDALSSQPLVRLPEQASHQRNLIEATPTSQLLPILDALNVLSSVSFRINTRILDVVIEVFKSDGNPAIGIPQPESKFPSLPPIKKGLSTEERSKAWKEVAKQKKLKAEAYGLWCYALYKLSIANHLRNTQFWLPVNLDFRGRVYAIAPHLNQLGDDVSRALLLFGQGKPLGPRGLDWIKQHLVNLYGQKKKSSLAERLEYANSVMADILDSADRPLTGRRWWQRGEEPWQVLACCLEIASAVRAPEGAENFVSSFPVHQDGSCNVLQHYSALGLDQLGAESVNLCKSDRPRDVYSDVGDKLEEIRGLDATAGVEIAKQLEGLVKRKVIKQTVMTTCYGVTKFGAKLQIHRQLKESSNLPSDQLSRGSTYLRDKTFEVLRQMFSSARQIQDWLTASAYLIAGICRRPVYWVTPLGLPVVQPYHQAHSDFRNGVRCRTTSDVFQLPNSMKQKNAFPPNFVHSLDSTHMMLTALHCFRSGLTFTSVHDSYWTHAATVEVMNEICRKQFVALHSQPILEQLSAHLLKNFGYEDVVVSTEENEATSEDTNFSKEKLDTQTAKRLLNDVFCQIPPRGNFELSNVLKSTYFFS